jgi:hypothetical protein
VKAHYGGQKGQNEVKRAKGIILQKEQGSFGKKIKF